MTRPDDALAAGHDALRVLHERGVARWQRSDLEARIALIDAVRASIAVHADDWVEQAAAIKGCEPGQPEAAEEYLTGPVPALRSLQAWRHSLVQLAQTGTVEPPAVHVRADGRVIVTTMPALPADRLLFAGYHARSRLRDSVTAPMLRADIAATYRRGSQPAGLALVLGSGNVTTASAIDVFDQLFGRNRVVLLKLSDVWSDLTEVLAAALAPLIEYDAVRIVAGDASVGAELVDDERLTGIHLTGSEATRQRIAAQLGSRPVEVTAEVGGITPIIVVPGPWRDREVRGQARNIATMLVNNGGYNCLAGRLLIQHRSWSQRRGLLDALRAELAQVPARAAFHPGARERWRQATSVGQVEHFGASADVDDEAAVLPWSLVTGLQPEGEWFDDDPFCGVLGETAMDVARSVPDFIDQAVERCNQQVNGALAAVIIVHPRSLLDAAVAAAVDRAVGNLRFGTVMINHFPGLAFGAMTTPWGSYNGHGWAHNTMMLPHVASSMVAGPFRPVLLAPWSHRQRHPRQLGRALVDYLATDDAKVLARLGWSSLRP